MPGHTTANHCSENIRKFIDAPIITSRSTTGIASSGRFACPCLVCVVWANSHVWMGYLPYMVRRVIRCPYEEGPHTIKGRFAPTSTEISWAGFRGSDSIEISLSTQGVASSRDEKFPCLGSTNSLRTQIHGRRRGKMSDDYLVSTGKSPSVWTR